MNGPCRISAVMSMPRLCFTDNVFCSYDVFRRLNIKLTRLSDVFWEQSLSRLLKDACDAGDDYVIVVDYDSLYNLEQLDELFKAIDLNGFDAVFPQQIKRNSNQVMGTPHPEEALDLSKPFSRMLTGHFGLTIIRCDALRKMPQPWFWGTPNNQGLWEEGEGRIDADNWFWVEFNRFGFKSYMANNVRIGHMELTATWPTQAGAIRRHVLEFQMNGVPKEALDQAGRESPSGTAEANPPGPFKGALCV